MSELEYYKSEVTRYQKKIEEEQARENMKEIAEKMHALIEAFLEAGFNEDQAWWMTASLYGRAIGLTSL